MKKIIIKFMLSTLITLSAHCSEEPWYSDYKIITSAIDFAVGIRTMINKPIMAINPDRFIKINLSKFKKIEQNLRQQEKKQINILLQKSKLTDKQIEKAFTILQLVQDNRKKYLSQTTQLNAQHDPELTDQINTINKQLIEKGLNSNNINIIQQEPINPNIKATNHGSIHQQYSIHHDGTINIDNYKITLQPDTIQFSPLYRNNKYKRAIAIHEAEHSIEGHSSTLKTISHIAYNINKICHNIEDNDIEELHHYPKLQQIIEQEADTFPSLRNAESASVMRNYRHNKAHAYLYDQCYEHYFNLSNIDETHKIITYLEHIKKHPCKQMPQVKRSKFF